MNDSPEWQSPGAPAGGAYNHESNPAEPGSVGFAAPQPSAGWTPPPKPGLIPLRPLDLGTILGAAFRTMRHNPRPTLGTALLVQGAVYVIGIGLVVLVTFLSLSRLNTASSQDQGEILAGSYGAIALSAIVPVLLSIAAGALLQGIVVLDVMRASLGEKPKLRRLLSMARGRIWALIGWTMLVILAVTVGIGALVLLIVLLAVTGSVAGTVSAVLLGVFGAIGCLVLWFWLNTKLSLVPSVLMAERTGIRTAMKRSWALTRRSFWKTLGIELLVAVIIGVATQVITTPISLVSGMLTTLADPNGQNPATAFVSGIAVYAVLVVVSVLFGAIGAVIQSATIALIYIDLRMRKEGLDLDLARFVEARQSGMTGLADPYARRPDQPPAPSTLPPSSESPWT